MRKNHARRTSSPLVRITVALGLILFTAILVAGCSSPQGAVPGDTVRVTYRMAFPGGHVIDSNENGTPLEFVIGSGRMIRGFDQAVVGMNPGQTRTVIIPPDQGYGRRNESMVGVINTEVLTQIMTELEKNGEFTQVTYPGIDDFILLYRLPDSTAVYYSFRNITPETTTVDQNHPLAGRELEATITLREIVKD